MQGWKIVIGGSLENYVQKVDVMYNFLISYTLTLSMARVDLLFTKNITSEHGVVCALPKNDETIQTRIHIASDRQIDYSTHGT